MDLFALESVVKSLEASRESIEVWLKVSTFLVVVGLFVEYWHPTVDLINLIKQKPPFPWKKCLEMTGGVIVIVGVFGELLFQSRASKVESTIRSDSYQIEGSLNREAGDARREASTAV